VGSSPLIGLLVVAAVLTVATGFGLWRRQRDGRPRPVLDRAPVPPALAGSALAGSDPVAPALTGSAPAGSAPAIVAGSGGEGAGGPGRLIAPGVLAGLGVEPGSPVTLLQFSSAFCAPCRATRRVLGEVSGLLDGVRHIEVDAESHLDAVRALDIRRTPTVLVVDARGRVVQRASGVPGKAQVIAAVAPLLSGARP
jgi:thiol-disulfide isomerase/thioredoxin